MTTDECHLFFRVDADSEQGTGHFMRCLALAQYWRDHHGPVTFAGSFPKELERRLEKEAISTLSSSSQTLNEQDVKAALTEFSGDIYVVIDGYEFEAPYHDMITVTGRRLLVIDDTAHLNRYGGHILLNQNICANELIYKDAPDVQLLGSDYVLLSRKFRNVADRHREDCEHPARNLLVTMGGADPGNDTLSALRALKNANITLNVRVIAGGANLHADEIQDFCDSQPDNYELFVDTKDMPAMMNWADIAIAAAGTTSWELLYMGVPTIFLAIAANQIPIGAGIAQRGAGKYLGYREDLDWRLVVETSLALATDNQERRSLTRAGQDLIDGEGVVRVAEKLRQDQKG